MNKFDETNGLQKHIQEELKKAIESNEKVEMGIINDGIGKPVPLSQIVKKLNRDTIARRQITRVIRAEKIQLVNKNIMSIV